MGIVSSLFSAPKVSSPAPAPVAQKDDAAEVEAENEEKRRRRSLIGVVSNPLGAGAPSGTARNRLLGGG